jgi:diadenosine tetraphosphate (Ap4A) HIT family hydrolase
MNVSGSACPFCGSDSAVIRNAFAYARYDKFPVTRGHLLVITRRHVADWFETTPEERQAVFALADEARTLLRAKFAPEGFNLGINVGEVAGQTIAHVHLHLIPRYRGDATNPRGGVRGVIPEKQNY